jgi:hypothetical protein
MHDGRTGVTERRRETRLEERKEKGSGREKSTKGFWLVW